jgi:hypothetical protein
MRDPNEIINQIEREQHEREAFYQTNAEQSPQPPIQSPQYINYSNRLDYFSDAQWKILTALNPSELDEVVFSIAAKMGPMNHKGHPNRYSHEDIILFVLVWIITGSKFNILSLLLQIPMTTLHTLIIKNIADIAKIAADLWIPKNIYEESQNHKFANFPEAIGAIDASLILITRPQSRELQRTLYSGKHKQHGFKIQAAVAPNRICFHFTSIYPGSTHDLTLFRQSNLTELITRPDGSHFTCLFDSGYQGIQHDVPEAIFPIRRQPNQVLTDEEKAFNQKLSIDRVIVEHFFGHLKTTCKILHVDFRCSHNLLNSVIMFCISFSNYITKTRPPVSNPENDNSNNSPDHFTSPHQNSPNLRRAPYTNESRIINSPQITPYSITRGNRLARAVLPNHESLYRSRSGFLLATPPGDSFTDLIEIVRHLKNGPFCNSVLNYLFPLLFETNQSHNTIMEIDDTTDEVKEADFNNWQLSAQHYFDDITEDIFSHK